MEHDNPEFEGAFGIYVGPATHDEVVAALRDVPPTSELVVRIDNRQSRPEEGIRYRHGWPEHFHEEYGSEGVRDLFLIHQHEQALGYGVMYQDALARHSADLILSFSSSSKLKPPLACTRIWEALLSA